MAQLLLVGQGLLIIEASNSHSDTPTSIGLLWNRDRPVAETSSWHNTTVTRDRHPCPDGIRTRSLSNRAAQALDRAATAFGEWAVISVVRFGYPSLTVFKGQYFSTRNSSNEVNIDVGPLILVMA